MTLDEVLGSRKPNPKATEIVYLHRLNNDGTPSGARDAISHFSSVGMAMVAHNYRVKVNPNSKISHRLVQQTDVITLHRDLHGMVPYETE